MRTYLIFYFPVIVIACAVCCCRNKKTNETSRTVNDNHGRVLKIFRSTEKVNLYVLRINKDFSYRDSLERNYSEPWSLINEYIPVGDSIKVYLKIDNKDTTFMYNIKDVDSILFGRSPGPSFYIINNLYKEAWLFD
ncbi:MULTISPECIES: hypothetical protein [Niastella]|uniref:Lipoprotein n=1 Tax=Niastella soli TaxID=2821487 RepID=A0ABS3YZM9_9BACT|nr:hypothetical protein [Niastella soli]MBO9203387.1 hypothetical protein [Niastella soli]